MAQGCAGEVLGLARLPRFGNRRLPKSVIVSLGQKRGASEKKKARKDGGAFHRGVGGALWSFSDLKEKRSRLGECQGGYRVASRKEPKCWGSEKQRGAWTISGFQRVSEEAMACRRETCSKLGRTLSKIIP